jgi:hypothetical protein
VRAERQVANALQVSGRADSRIADAGVVEAFRDGFFSGNVLRDSFCSFCGKRTWSGTRNLFYDYFVTPRVAFLPLRTIEEWCEKQQARILRYDENRGQNVHSFLVEKERRTQSPHDPASVVVQERLTQEKRETA